MLNVGDRVRITKRIWDPADDHHPGGMLAKIGDEVTIKRIAHTSDFPYKVAHDWVTDDGTFGVNDTEIECIS